jgi:hypothetical protein
MTGESNTVWPMRRSGCDSGASPTSFLNGAKCRFSESSVPQPSSGQAMNEEHEGKVGHFGVCSPSWSLSLTISNLPIVDTLKTHCEEDAFSRSWR